MFNINIQILKCGCKGTVFFPSVQVFLLKKRSFMHKWYTIVQFFLAFYRFISR